MRQEHFIEKASYLSGMCHLCEVKQAAINKMLFHKLPIFLLLLLSYYIIFLQEW